MSGFHPENDLERALVAAADDPANAPAFYRTLLDSKLLVIDESAAPAQPGQRTLDAGTQLRLRPLEIEGQPHVPVFSALSRLQAFINSQVNYLSIGARDLFAILRDSHVVLNPGADYGKQFLPSEVAAIVDGSIFSQQSTYVVPEATQVLLGQPAEYPSHITNALKRFFATRSDVRAAYLAHYHNPARDEKPCTLIGVDASGDWAALVGGASLVLGQVARSTDVVDFIRIDASGISRYMVNETKPFYRRKRFGLL